MKYKFVEGFFFLFTKNSRKAVHFHALNAKINSLLTRVWKDLNTNWENTEWVNFFCF